jgi:hypothetical protein
MVFYKGDNPKLINDVIKILDDEKLDFHYSIMFVDCFIADYALGDMDEGYIANKIIKWVNEKD